MRPTYRALQCLEHPATITCVALLILNDHVFKIIAPSWITGKLSDFAGLFFFPFLLAIVFGVGTRRAGEIAFAITAIWFAAIKTSPIGITLTQDWLAPILGYRVPITLDPTDLIALVALIPAYYLWKTRVPSPRTNARAWLLLGIASLAAIATTPAPLKGIHSVTSRGNLTYARMDTTSGSPTWFVSENGGRVWTSTTMTIQSPLPQMVCEPDQPDICYRVIRKEHVEASHDGGKTWSIAWQVPAERQDFIRRARSFGALPFDAGPYDLTLSEPIGKNGLHTLIVAAGEQGVLVRAPDGKWDRYAVGELTPTPFAAPDIFLSVFYTWGELVTLGLVAGAVFFVLAIVLAIAQTRKRMPSRQATLLSGLCMLLIVLVGFLPIALWAVGTIPGYDLAEKLMWIGAGIMSALTFVPLGIGILRARHP